MFEVARLPMGTVPPTEKNGDFGRSPLSGQLFERDSTWFYRYRLGSIDIGRLVKDFLPAPGRSGSRSGATLAPLFRRGWPPSWIRKKSRNARSGWFGQRDRFPIATASAAGRGSSRQPKSLHDRSWPRTLSHIPAKLAGKSVALKIKACTHLFNNRKANTYGG